jgi:DNA-binding ferritin-like protein
MRKALLEAKSETFRDYLLELAERISMVRQSPVKHAERMRRKLAAYEAPLEKIDQKPVRY